MGNIVVRTASVLALLLYCSSASAVDREVARAHYLAGQRAYNLGEYRQALSEFKLAYANSDDPALLFNLGQCFRAMGEWHVAARFYRNFLQQPGLDQKTRVDVERIVLEMERAITEGRQVAPPLGMRPPENEHPPEGEVVSPYARDPAPSVGAATVSPQSRPRGHARAAGWSLLAGGAVLAIVGGALYGINVSSPGDSLQMALQARRMEDSLDASGGAMLGIGSAAVVAGAVTLGIGWKK